MINSISALSGDAVSLVQQLLKKADLNGDGSVTTKEFSAMLTDAMTHPATGAVGDAAAQVPDAKAILEKAQQLDFSRIDALPGSSRNIVASIAAYVKFDE
jgi:hypothetical protein